MEDDWLIGRQAELGLLAAALARALRGSQQLVLLEGDPGIGKTELLYAFTRMHRRRGFRRPRFFYLRAPGNEAYEPIEHAALAATDRRFYARLGGKRQATEMARSLLTDWLPAVPMWGALMAATAATANALARRRREAPKRGLRGDEDIDALISAATRRPLVLLLDNLERADNQAVARLEALVCAADEGVRLLVVGAYRPTAPGVPDPPIHRLLKTLPAENEAYEHRRLQALHPDDVERWLRERFPGATIPAVFLDWFIGSTGGHPGTMESTLSHLVGTGAVRQDDDQWSFETDPDRLDLPIIGLSFADLSTINPYIADVIRSASVLGDDFDALTLARLLERDELAVEDQLALGVHYGVLRTLGEVERDDGELTTGYRFAEPHVRAALRSQLPPDERARLDERRVRLVSESPA